MRLGPPRFMVLRHVEPNPGIQGLSPSWQSVIECDTRDLAVAWLYEQNPKSFKEPAVYRIAVIEGDYEVAARIEVREAP